MTRYIAMVEYRKGAPAVGYIGKEDEPEREVRLQAGILARRWLRAVSADESQAERELRRVTRTITAVELEEAVTRFSEALWRHFQAVSTMLDAWDRYAPIMARLRVPEGAQGGQ